MKETYGDALVSFANSSDMLRREEFTRALSATRRYLEQNFQITKIERLAEIVQSGVPHLVPTLNRDDEYQAYPVRVDDDEPYGLNASAFVSKSKTWVVPQDDGDNATLDSANRYLELWDPGSSGELPRYIRLPDSAGNPRPSRNTRSLISIPMIRRGSTVSLVYFESDVSIRPSERGKQELLRIALSVSRLFDLQTQNEENRAATQSELEALDDASRIRHDWGIEVPSLFWAYPDDADTDVLATLQSKLREYSTQGVVRLFDWQENAEGGRVPAKIESEIRAATYFVAYLSEAQSDPSKPRYVDNPNVIYEAGVFQGLADDPTARGRSWLLIRERDSAKAPFDIATVNTLTVPRDETGSLTPQILGSEVEKRLKTLFKATLQH